MRIVSDLPVAEIADKVNASLAEVPRLVVTAPPGAGKSTLLPLTILETVTDGKIIMLEPRRIAAREIAVRMSAMLGEKVGQTVGYRMRFEAAVSAATRIEVVTEGILERMLVDDPFLEGVAVVIFDEFHERSLTSDLTFALVREAQKEFRPDLRIVAMSATIDAASLCEAMDAPLLESKGRMFDVDIVYGENTDSWNCAADVAATVKKAWRERQGDILAFLPGQGEILKCGELLGDSLGSTLICPLYGLLASDSQRVALRPSPAGMRKVVLATPIAETSLTIEGVNTVVDSGLCRTLKFNPATGLSRLETERISLDMATQRSGRAGRLGPGVCYRLWNKPIEHRMADCRRPEILDADLAPMVLEIASWGENNPARLPWITPPPPGHIASAVNLLKMLGALDDKGAVTELGHRLAALPCHPRIAIMLVLAADNSQKALAADIAALLEEKDPLADENNADINVRIEMLRRYRTAKSGKWERINRIAAQYRRLVGAKEDNSSHNSEAVGRLIAKAYPERIAMQDDGARYRMASGDYVSLSADDDLCAEKYLAVASTGAHIFLAAHLSRESLDEVGSWRENVSWNSREGRTVARRELRIGVLVIATAPVDGDIREQVLQAICESAPKEGLTMFDFNDDVARLQIRLACAAEWHPELGIPDVSTESILASASEWLSLYIGKARSVQELRKIDMTAVIMGLLTYEQQQAVERITPARFVLPCGRSVRIDYRQGAEAPVISARLQDCFGLTDTPCLDGGTRPVLMELLSPGFKPVQLTQDLKGFWQNTYFEVRKELRRRYPKHAWPENPLEFNK